MENYTIIIFILSILIGRSALGVTKHLPDGNLFPERNAILFISVVVVLLTIVGQGLSIPWIVKKLNLKEEEK